MKRRDFLLASSAAIGGGFMARGQSTVASPIRTARVVDPSITGRVNSQDALFDGKNLIYLYRNAAPMTPGGPVFNVPLHNAPFWITATTATGKLLWSYPLPSGMYLSLGTHDGSVVLLANRYGGTAGTPTARPVLSLDSATGNLTPIGTQDGYGLYVYAGDSTFFRIVDGAGQIWNLGNGLVQKLSGIASPTIRKKPTATTFLTPATIAVVDDVGASMALISIESGAVQESTISSETITNAQAFSGVALARAGYNANNPRMATVIFITGIGADENGAVYAAVPLQKARGVAIVKLDANGNGTTLGAIQKPFDTGFMISKLVVSGTELGVLSHGGDIAWYQLPLS
jgi:hypothetical protein